jgi:peroxiredoxin
MPFVPLRPTSQTDLDSRRARLAVIAATVGILAALLAYAISPSVRHSINHAVHRVLHISEAKAAPALPGEVLVPPKVGLHDLRGHNALVIFWSGACPACRREAAAVERFATGAGSGRVVGVDYDGDARTARVFIDHHHWTYPNLLDAGGKVGRRYGVSAARELPVTYVLDSSGHIVRTLHGPQTEAQLQAALKKGES